MENDEEGLTEKCLLYSGIFYVIYAIILCNIVCSVDKLAAGGHRNTSEKWVIRIKKENNKKIKLNLLLNGCNRET